VSIAAGLLSKTDREHGAAVVGPRLRLVWVLAQPELDGVEVPPVELELADPLEEAVAGRPVAKDAFCAASAVTLSIMAWAGEVVETGAEFEVVAVCEVVVVVAGVVVPAFAVEVAAGVVVPVVLAGIMVPAVVVVPVDEVPVVLVAGTAVR
jgi:hypothetical protein